MTSFLSYYFFIFLAISSLNSVYTLRKNEFSCVFYHLTKMIVVFQ
ncbi:hypothetical protein CUZ96_1530 [Enterococcus lactis]|nr:hypothetical protein [Enterococcus lactis]MBL4991210.1 hypothetical protein [Enterococcus lactis]MBL4993983.1 hypothetical protein [Enterococcus lactis]MBL4996430.1 hypothetical protein [Enterococcus lactis]MBL4999440.1 hypothetical protein [Enterococcus lactis]